MIYMTTVEQMEKQVKIYNIWRNILLTLKGCDKLEMHIAVPREPIKNALLVLIKSQKFKINTRII